METAGYFALLLVIAMLFFLIFGTDQGDAAVPVGFRESSRLALIAQELSVPEAKVYCALTPASWRDSHPGNERWAAIWSTTNGTTGVEEHIAYLAPWTCQPLELWKRGKAVRLTDVGKALLTLGHESVHLRGVLDERTAECTALRELRLVARTYFGIKTAKAWRQVWAGAHASHVLVLDALRVPPC